MFHGRIIKYHECYIFFEKKLVKNRKTLFYTNESINEKESESGKLKQCLAVEI